MKPDSGKIVPLQDIPLGEREKWIKWNIGEEVEVKGCIFKLVRVKSVRKQIYLEYVARAYKDIVMTPEGRDNFMKEVTERLAEETHQLWIERVKKEGRHAPKDCPIKINAGQGVILVLENGTYCTSCHPCMVPYNELPEDKKLIDRDYPQTLFNILDEMGYKLVRK